MILHQSCPPSLPSLVAYQGALLDDTGNGDADREGMDASSDGDSTGQAPSAKQVWSSDSEQELGNQELSNQGMSGHSVAADRHSVAADGDSVAAEHHSVAAEHRLATPLTRPAPMVTGKMGNGEGKRARDEDSAAASKNKKKKKSKLPKGGSSVGSFSSSKSTLLLGKSSKKDKASKRDKSTSDEPKKHSSKDKSKKKDKKKGKSARGSSTAVDEIDRIFGL
jgi:hypothetical protein